MQKDTEGILTAQADGCEAERPLSQDSASQDAEYLLALSGTSVFESNSLQECLLPEGDAISRGGTSFRKKHPALSRTFDSYFDLSGS